MRRVLRVSIAFASRRAAAIGSAGSPSARESTLVPPPGRKPIGTSRASPFSASLKPPSPEKTTIASEAQFELGLDLVAPVRVRRRTLLPTALSILSGHVRGRKGTLYGHDLDRVEIVADRPMPLQADGEDLGDVEEAIFEAERGAVSVFV